MELYSFPFIFFHLSFSVLLLHTILTCFFLPVQPLCHDNERIALLKFKESLTINESVSQDPSAYPKVSSWTVESTDCCSWDGVKCDTNTGHVIALDLNSSCLYGSINSSSTLFSFVHLQRLNLADNHFNYSLIPSELSHLSKLTHLNLSLASFKGQIPSQFSLLSNLSLLDLSFVNIYTQVPKFLVNLTSLTDLLLRNCSLYGEFPNEIFQLPKLQFLAMQLNQNLTGSFPEFKSSSHLRKIWFSNTSFSGNIPLSIGNLDSLEYFNVAKSNFSGFPPSSIGKLTKLTYLDLSYNNFIGPIPYFLQNLTNLTVLWFGGNQLTGQIPSWIGNLTNLNILSFARNKLFGPVPQSLSRLTNLRTLNLFENDFDGIVDFDMFFGIENLAELRLDGNIFSVIIRDVNATRVVRNKFQILGLNFCNLSHFPDFLRYQDELRYLDLGGNNIYGQVPRWVWNSSIETMAYLAVNDNFLTSIDQSPSEEFSQNLFCSLKSLQLLDLSNNLLSGLMLPKCMENSNNLLSVLNLRNNSFHGTIPQICTTGGTSSMKMIDLSYNQFKGPIPQSIANCLLLEYLNLGDNKLYDVFPSWLGTLPKLRLLILRSNYLHGMIANPFSASEFPNLRVVDVSFNNFTGGLPSEYFQNWNAMKAVDSSNSYLKTKSSFEAVRRTWTSEYTYSTTMTIKGKEVQYGKIQEVLVVIDFSSNRFQGGIPDSIGSLQGLRVLNLSNNTLSGEIPSSLGNITSIESLDLSRNELNGEIPQWLVELTFLSFLNVSYNHFVGRIPRGNQLNTFENSSYVGNLGLCGDPLSKKCGDSEPLMEPTNSIEEKEDSESSSLEFHWTTVVLGYATGVVVGIVVEKIVKTKKQKFWLVKPYWLRKSARLENEEETLGLEY